jgi:phosphoenolpyruvate-protein phosphotransferase (PTS system enzyme I)
MTTLKGRGVAPGVAIGGAVVVTRDASTVRYRLAASGVERERQRLRTARDRTRRDLEDISERMARTLGAAQAAIFAAQLLMLDDPLLARRADDLIRTQRINAEWALDRAVAELHEALVREGDAWVRDRVGDVSDVTGRMCRHLRPGTDSIADRIREIDPPVILVADDLPPSAAAQLDWTRVRGLVCDGGSPTSHTVILARSVGVPAVVGLAGVTQVVMPGQVMAIDGTSGHVVVEPSDAILEAWQRREAETAAHQQAFDYLRDRPARTRDGTRIRLDANLEIADEVWRVQESGAEGIGLYRSEFLLDPGRPDAIDEETQVGVYRALLAAMAPLPVTIRTFDAPEEAGPAARGGRRERFGARGIRTVLEHDERFCTQIRALLRAADAGVLRILLPFVSTGDELQRVRAVMAQVAQESGLPQVPVGAMIEVPSAALTVDSLADHADFLSVGTNDLIQYTLAVDRTDERLAGHYEPASPAVLRLLRTIAVQGRRAGCPLSVCGEMAGDPLMVSLLVGLGFRAFSVTPAAVPRIKQTLAAVDVPEVTRLARRSVLARSAAAVRDMLVVLGATLPAVELTPQ